jgi:hypothetical protein
VCRFGVFGLPVPGRSLAALPKGRDIVVPAALLMQYGATGNPKHVVAALRALGCRYIRPIEDWILALRVAVLEYARKRDVPWPVISPSCPAVVNLIRSRFPALLPSVAPFLTPIEAACVELGADRSVFAVPCPACHALVGGDGALDAPEILHVGELRRELLPMVSITARRSGQAVLLPEIPAVRDPDLLVIYELAHCLRVLDGAERGLVPDIPVLELYACQQGCFGSPYMIEDPFLTRQRWLRLRRRFVRPALAVTRVHPLTARRGPSLDESLPGALDKLREIEALARTMPGRDCCACGAPGCAALAEDVVLARAPVTACPYRNGSGGES